MYHNDEILSREGIYFTPKGWAEIRQETKMSRINCKNSCKIF